MYANRFRTLLAAIFLFGVVLCGGCARIAANKALKQYEESLKPLLNKSTKDDFIKSWGPPQSVTPVSDGEVCVWVFSHGSRAFATGGYYAVQAQAIDMYDKLTMTFNEAGVLQQYQAFCQR